MPQNNFDDNIVSGNGLEPSGMEPLLKIMLTQIYDITRQQWIKCELIQFCKGYASNMCCVCIFAENPQISIGATISVVSLHKCSLVSATNTFPE